MNEYDWAKTHVAERDRRRSNRWIYYQFSDLLKQPKRLWRRAIRHEISMINRFAPKGGGRFLDVGCGGGKTLRSLDRTRWVPFGIEPSATLAAQASAYCNPAGGAVIQDVAVAAFSKLPSQEFQCILMLSYLEHEVFVGPILHLARQALAPDGVVIIKVPNYACWNARLRGAGWPGVRLPDHVNYFLPAHLKQAVQQAGFGKVIFPTRFRLPTSDNMWLVAGAGLRGG